MALRGWNHSRRLFFLRLRKKANASVGKPLNPIIVLMTAAGEVLADLTAVPDLRVSIDTPLSRYTRFGIGGPADIYAETESVEAFVHALQIVRSGEMNHVVIGGGTNLIVSDQGFRGIV